CRNFILFIFAKENNGIINSHRENVVYIFILERNFKHFLFETFAVASIAHQMNICHKLHFDGYFAFAFAGFTTAAIHIEGKMFRFVTSNIRKFLGCEEIPNIIVSLNIRYGIASAGTANWVLVDEFNAFYGVEIALYF